MNFTTQKTFIIILILITSLFVGICDCKAQQKVSAIQDASNYQTSLSTVNYSNPIAPKVEKWKVTSVTSSTNSDMYKDYIKRPYHNPNLIRDNEIQQQNLEKARVEQELRKQKEKDEKLQAMAENFYRVRRQSNGYTNGVTHRCGRKYTHRVVVPYNEFKTACLKYYKKNKLIQTGQE